MKIAAAQHRLPVREALQLALSLRPGHEITWVANTATEAIQRCVDSRPDLLLLELDLPDMGGAQATRLIMSAAPCAILVVTRGFSGQASSIFQALGQGALDVVDILLISRASMASAAVLRKQIDAVAASIASSRDALTAFSRLMWAPPLVVMGASAGGPSAIARILQDLPKSFPAAMVIVQHMQSRLAGPLAQWLQEVSSLPVRVARENDALKPGVVLVSSVKSTLRLKRSDRLGYSNGLPSESTHYIDALFESAGIVWPGAVAGVLLTGMGSDGATGLRAMRNAGHYTVAQKPESSTVHELPQAAIAIDAAEDVLAVEQIGEHLVSFCERWTAGRQEHRGSPESAIVGEDSGSSL